MVKQTSSNLNTVKKFYQNYKFDIPNHTKEQNELYNKRCKEFYENQIGFGKIVMLGDSITEGGGNWNKYFN